MLPALSRITGTAPRAARHLPPHVAARVRDHQDSAEKLIGWVQLAVVVVFGVLYAAAPMTFSAAETFAPVPYALAAYTVFTLVRLGAAHRVRLPDAFLYGSIVIDLALLFGLIWSFHLQYGQPPSFYLKAPTLLYVFIFIALRALRFEARFVVATGAVAALGWLALAGYAVVDGGMGMITRDYVAYMTGNRVLLGAEVDKVVSILLVTAILAVAITRARALLVSAVAEHAAARSLARFLSPEVAARVTRAEGVDVGAGEARDAAILQLDLRGFTQIAETCAPDAAMRLLASYQAALVPVIRAHGGSIDKFLGDGILATFDGAGRPDSYAADAVRCADAALDAGARWQRERAADGLAAPPVNAAVTSGRVVFGVVGDRERLEYTVIGEAVNVAAKVEKHNAAAGTRMLVTRAALDRARAQGYAGDAVRELPACSVAGLPNAVDLVALA